MAGIALCAITLITRLLSADGLAPALAAALLAAIPIDAAQQQVKSDTR